MHATTGRYSARGKITVLVFGLAVLAASALPGADVYVSTSAAPASPYATWATAFTNVQAALNYISDGDTVYLAGQTFSGSSDGTKVYALTNRSNVTLRGGYEADPAKPLPGAQDPAQWPTALARSGAMAGRVLNLSGLTNATFEGVTIRGGNFNPGGGINVASSTVVFDNCIVSNNYANVGQGGAFYIASSTVTLTNAVVSGNKGGRGNDGTQAQGGAAYLGASAVMNIYRSTIAQNTALSSRQQPSYGGAFYLSASTSELNARESVITNNAATTEWAGGIGRGGAIYNAGGKVRLSNVLVARNTTALTATDPSSGIMSAGTAPVVLLENCTVADNDAGAVGSVGLRRIAGTFAVTNSIVWGHVTDLFNVNLAHVAYSDIGDGQNVGLQGCQSVNPQFVDTLYYHLMSTAGHYTGGAFSDGSWTTATITNSPVIDRGDPVSDYSREPAPNGGRINMGAYANTQIASLSPTITATLPAVSNAGAGFRSHTAARLYGSLTDDGGQLPDITFYYWLSGNTATSTVPIGMREEGAFDVTVNGLASGASYEYSISASNSAGTAWSGVASFGTLAANATIYVSTSGDNTDASTWAKAYRDPATAFSIAEPGDTIRLAGQTFSNAPGFGLNYVYLLDGKTNMTVEGGYEATDATPGARDPKQWPTILKRSSGTASVLKIQNASGVVVEGVTLTGGNNIQGGGVYLSGTSQTVVFADCTITNNFVPAAGNTTDGGAGVFLGSGSAVLTNCLVAGNQIVPAGIDNYYGPGGGVRISGGTLTIRNSTIANNVALGNNKNTAPPYTRGSDGGGIYIAAGGVLDLAESIVTNNRALQGAYPCWTHGGGIANAGGTARLRNVLLVGNMTIPTVNQPSSGIYASGTTALENCTVANNDTNKTDSVGIRFVSGVLAVTNTITWGHTNDLSNIPTNSEGQLLNVSCSMAGVVLTGSLHGVNGSVVGDPLFVGGGDYQLQRESPAVNAGFNLPWMTGASDLAGQARIRGRTVDMGAYEAESRGGGVLLMVR